MKGSMDTHLGNIMVDPDVIAQYAGSVAVECFGIVGMTNINITDGIAGLLKKENIKKGIRVKFINNRLYLDFHIIIAYGINVITVTDNLISNVKYKVEKFTGLEVEKINIFVEGVRVID